MSARRATLRIGASGYQYDHWKGQFYPHALPQREWFAYYAAHFDTVEINNTFYHLPTNATFDAWRKQAPPGFCYALKFSRYGSHLKHLKDPQASLEKFLDRAQRLEGFLGPILVQLPPRWTVNPHRLSGFLEAAQPSIRWAFEFRDSSWLCEEIFAILRRHNAALCIHDIIDGHPRLLTADWTYLRFHGDNYNREYSSRQLTAQARWIKRQLADGTEVFVYFNNDAHAHAVKNAADLRRYVRGE